MRADRFVEWIRASWVDVVWVVFVGINLLAMQVSPPWQTVPFLIIWVSLTALYGFRLWRLGSAIATVAAVTLATGGLITWQVLVGVQDTEYLLEVPLMAMLFVIVVWHARRRQTALEEMRRVAGHNSRLLEQQRRFLQDASHELGTPITVALGHAELIQRAASDPAIARDAGVAVEELLRLRRLANNLLLLASAEGSDFVRPAPLRLDDVVLDAISRWSHVPRRWSISGSVEATVSGDADALRLALDALIENAIRHTAEGDRIELGGRREGAGVVLSVADSGPGVPRDDQARIFDRFARVDGGRSRETGGVGLGLAIVKAIAEAHGGSARVRSVPGRGAAFEIVLPESATGAAGTQAPDESAILRSPPLAPGSATASS